MARCVALCALIISAFSCSGCSNDDSSTDAMVHDASLADNLWMVADQAGEDSTGPDIFVTDSAVVEDAHKPDSCSADCDAVDCGPDPICGLDCGGCDDGFGCKQGQCVEANPGLPEGKVKGMAVANRIDQVVVDGYLAFEEWAESEPLLVSTKVVESIGGTSWQVGGDADLSATVALLWNDDYLYVAAEVMDDVHDVGDSVPGQWWWEDSISLFFNLSGDAQGDQWLDGDNGFSFLFAEAGTAGAVWWRQGHDSGVEEIPGGQGVEVAVEFTAMGYVLEAAIPMKDLSANIGYEFGPEVGFTMLLADPDGDCQDSPCQLMWVGTGDDQAGWGTLTFSDPKDDEPECPDGPCPSGMDLWPAVPEGGPTGPAYPAMVDDGGGGVAPAPPTGPRTIFQTNAHYQAELAVRADQVLVHRHSHDGGDIKNAISSWKGHGYQVGRMFFVGSDPSLEYSGSLNHPDVERNKDGNPIEVDGRPYMVPSPAWTQWTKDLTNMSVDGGAATIYPEEPLLHHSGGYSQRFKDAWSDFYGSSWQEPGKSVSNSWMAGKLKADLYYQLISELAGLVAKKGLGYVVPVHSLLSFASGKMVYPHGRTFIHPKVDGMIGQVWTWPVKSLLDGEHEQCSTNDANHKDCGFFESAFLLYSYFANLQRGSGKSMYFLADPADDNPNSGWPEYEEWYKETVAAGLSFPWISQFELLPWPDRIYLPSTLGGSGPTPEPYLIQLQAIFNVQRDVGNHPEWEAAASDHNLGVVVGDSLMWTGKSPFKTEGVAGMAFPLVRNGITVNVVPIERFDEPEFLQQYRTLVVAFDGWKPLEKARLENLVDWVKAGGVLLLMGSGDAHDKVSEWWTQEGFASPATALLFMLEAGVKISTAKTIMPDLLGFVSLSPVVDTPLSGELGKFDVPRPPIDQFEAFASGGKVIGFDLAGARALYEADGKTVIWDQNLGKGAVVFAGISPTDLPWSQAGTEVALALARYAGEAWGGLPMRTKSHFHLRRGPYHVISVHGAAPVLSGSFLDVFQPDLPVVKNPQVPVGRVRLYKQVDSLLNDGKPRVLHANQELVNLSETSSQTSFLARGPGGTPARVRVSTAGKSVAGVTGGVEVVSDGGADTVLLKFSPAADGKQVEVSW